MRGGKLLDYAYVLLEGNNEPQYAEVRKDNPNMISVAGVLYYKDGSPVSELFPTPGIIKLFSREESIRIDRGRQYDPNKGYY